MQLGLHETPNETRFWKRWLISILRLSTSVLSRPVNLINALLTQFIQNDPITTPGV